MNPKPQHHFGVYGVFIQDNKILCVRKSRGPYKGYLDLPGGSVQDGEDNTQALLRELREETGASSKILSPWQDAEVNVFSDSEGNPIIFHHAAKWCYVQLKEINFDKDALEDVAGLEWLPLDSCQTRKDLSALLKAILVQMKQLK